MCKKIISLLICLLTLSACVTNNISDFEAEVNKGIEGAMPINNSLGVNNITKYFSYYLPKDMTEYVCEETYAVFNFNESPIVMNLNIANIINKKYFTNVSLSSDDYFNKEKLIYSKTGALTTKKGIVSDYLINIYSRDDTSVYIEFVTPNMCFHSVCVNSMLSEVIKHIVIMVQYIQVDDDLVLKNYYDRDLIDYQKKNVDLFDRIIPAHGRLDEMIIDE